MKNYILISDSQQLFKESLQSIINNEIDASYICKYCCDYKILTDHINTVIDGIKLIILSTNLSDITNINDTISDLRTRTEAPILVTSTINDETFANNVTLSGATSYALKSISHPDFKKVIQNTLLHKKRIELGDPIHNHDVAIKSKLTNRQYEILIEISSGLLNKEIAYKLKISEATVKVHVSSILNKLAVNNRTEASNMLYRSTHSLITP